jgi:glycosyltransferase involved in cell wall biosynthesis
MPPRVSVLMTAYNREPFIAEAIESVLAQTFTDFELIIVDDGSKDRTVEIALSYAARDSRIQVVVNERNLGDYPNRNRAAELATGEFIKYHDSDDAMYPHCLAIMVETLAAYPEATVALTGEWQGGPLPMLLTPRLCYEREFLGFGMFAPGPPSTMFRRGRFAELGYFELAGPHSDLAMWLRICKTENVLLVPAGLYWYRVHAGQHLATPGAARDRAIINRRVWEALQSQDCPLDLAGRHIARINWTWLLAKGLYFDLRAGNFSLAWFAFRKCGLRVQDWFRYLRRPKRHRFAGTPLHPDGTLIFHRYKGLSPMRDERFDPNA